MEIEDLRIFLEVAESGGVSAAALLLGISKTIINRRITQLEADLGAQLLARKTRGMVVTENGVTFRANAARICAEVDMALEAVSQAGELQGE